MTSTALSEAGLRSDAICKQMGVAFLVEGTILPRRLGAQIVVKLISGKSGEQLWSGAFKVDCDEDEGPDERVALGIAHALWSAIDISEGDKFVRLNVEPQSNYERYWLANSLYRTWDRVDVAKAALIAQELAQLDNRCPWANSLAAFCTAWAWLFKALPDQRVLRDNALRFEREARKLGPDNVETLGYCAATLTILNADLELADSIISHSMRVLPDHQPTHFWGGWIDLTRGDARRAGHRFQRSLQINPTSGVKSMTLCGMGAALLMNSESFRAVERFDEAILTDPGSPIAKLGRQIAVEQRDHGKSGSQQPSSWSEALPMLSQYLAQTNTVPPM